MRAIIIPLFIIAILVGIYYAGDVWKSVQSGSQEKSAPAPSPSPSSPFDVLK